MRNECPHAAFAGRVFSAVCNNFKQGTFEMQGGGVVYSTIVKFFAFCPGVVWMIYEQLGN